MLEYVTELIQSYFTWFITILDESEVQQELIELFQIACWVITFHQVYFMSMYES